MKLDATKTNDSANQSNRVTNTGLVSNMPIPITNNFTVGSFTTGDFQLPQGEVMKLSLSNVHAEEPNLRAPEPAFGKHIREAIAIVKDWKQRP